MRDERAYILRRKKENGHFLLSRPGTVLAVRDLSVVPRRPDAKLVHVQWLSSDHLYWTDLDVDLAVESIEHPERFPPVSKVRRNYRLDRARSARR